TPEDSTGFPGKDRLADGIEPLRAAGAVILQRTAAGDCRVALLKRQNTVCLPRVLLRTGESTRVGAIRAAHDQVSSHLHCADWHPLSTVRAQVSDQPLITEYWSASTTDVETNLQSDCFWSPLNQAAEQVAFPEERQFLSTMEDPLIQVPPLQAEAPSESPDEFPPVPTSSPLKSRWPFDPHRGRLAETIAAARSSVENAGRSGDWRESALMQLTQAEDAVQAGHLEAAQESLTGAWRLELESRSVGERRLMTQLLQGEVRTRTEGWHRDSLLTALQESPDAGTMALVRCELERKSRRVSQEQTQNDLGRLAQLIVAIPVALTLAVSFSSTWLDGSVPSDGSMVPATLGLGLLGGLGWSLFRGRLRNFFEALAPLGAGAAAAFFGMLLAKAGILNVAEDSAPLALCMSILWGLAAGALLDFKRGK
ncbi:MAG: hypothetical protein P1V35_03535, partial [Planctomycetota bacterium]|nr:hypothetical protein [Planctomycetota bacterium]